MMGLKPMPPVKRPEPLRDDEPVRKRSIHPAAEEALSNYSETLELYDAKVAECRQLSQDLEIEQRHNADLRKQLADVRARYEYFRSYAVEIETHLNTITGVIEQARTRAAEASRNEPKMVEAARVEPPRREPDAVADVEQEMARLIKGNNGQGREPTIGQ